MMRLAVPLLAAAALAAEPAPRPPLPDGGRWSGPLFCRFPEDAPLKRAALLAQKDKDGTRRLVLRGMDGKGVIADERILVLTPEEDRDGERPDPRVSRRKHYRAEAVRFKFSARRANEVLGTPEDAAAEPEVTGVLLVEPDEKTVTLRADRTAVASLLGGACEGTLKREKTE